MCEDQSVSHHTGDTLMSVYDYHCLLEHFCLCVCVYLAASGCDSGDLLLQIIFWDLHNLCTKHSVNSLGGYAYALSVSAVHPGAHCLNVYALTF